MHVCSVLSLSLSLSPYVCERVCIMYVCLLVLLSVSLLVEGRLGLVHARLTPVAVVPGSVQCHAPGCVRAVRVRHWRAWNARLSWQQQEEDEEHSMVEEDQNVAIPLDAQAIHDKHTLYVADRGNTIHDTYMIR